MCLYEAGNVAASAHIINSSILVVRVKKKVEINKQETQTFFVNHGTSCNKSNVLFVAVFVIQRYQTRSEILP